ncbi:hypothetical protein SAMN02910355_2239 [Terrisporobacter glycolicus]|nr:hypothetical protein SAMN02910355_2239 [Terrisporobacter glycolicus]
MSYLDRKDLLSADLMTRSISKEGSIKYYNSDKNVANIYMKLIAESPDGAQKEVAVDEASNYTVTIDVIKPKTNQIRTVPGVLSTDLPDETCAIWKFELGEDFTNQIGEVICQTYVKNTTQNLTMRYFAYTVEADKLTGLNSEIVTDPDLPILKELIKEVQETAQTVNNIDNVNVSDTKTYSNKKIEEKFSGVDAQFNTVGNKSKRYGTMIRNNYPKVLIKNEEYIFPSEFSLRYDNLPKVYKNKQQFITDFNVSNYKNASSKIVYVDVINGLSTNDGLTRQTPYQSITKALILASDGDTIKIINDKYTLLGRHEWTQSTTINKSVNIEAENKVIVFMGDKPTWVVNTTYSNVYEVTRNNVVKVADLNEIERPRQYKQVDGLINVSNTPYSFYCDGTKTYINTNGNTPTRVLPIIASGLALTQNGNTQNIKLYLENIIFVGGYSNIRILGDANYNQHELYTKNCECYFSTDLDSILSLNCKRSYHQKTICAYSRKDGFNYSTNIGNSSIVDFIEIDCIAYGNGDNSNTIQTPNTHNGSTAHAKSRGIRINGICYGNYGGNIIDAQEVKSVNLGCITYDSLATDSNWNQGMGTQGGSAIMWIDGCISFNNFSDIYCPTGDTITVVNSMFDTINGNGNKTLSNNS